MKNMLKSALALTLSYLMVGTGFARTYTVVKGDTLSQIVAKEVGTPVWGKSGTLRQVLQLNRDIANPDLIYPNQIIILSPEDESVAEEVPAPDVTSGGGNGTSLGASTVYGTGRRYQDEITVYGITSDTARQSRGVHNEFETELHSNTNFGGMAAWHRYFRDDIRGGAFFSVVNSKYEGTVGGAVPAETKSLKTFGLDVEKGFGERFRVGALFAVEQHMFLGRAATATLELEPVFVDSVGVFSSYDILKFSKAAVGVGGHGKYASGSEGEGFEVQSGMVYGGNAYADYRFAQQFKVLGAVFYDRRLQNTDEARERTSEQGVRVGLGYEY